ncbi:uncharacterized protein LOC123312813 isoform X2 [Coccinella septempunctata]|uniref:uncharacterized protein LOC123312813 isoform X2 n=1 Tax=Coccinella septempunctata TaxID=41139 RepID=UPI001D05FCBF|nr:uncharacterized protein LOC123312813 isoform X2 [Coccinella septempunctata]
MHLLHRQETPPQGPQDMNYQKVLQPQPHFYGQQIFYENPEYIDEAEDSFIDTVSYSESDGFIGFPMVRSVPSYDIQELYIRKPMATASQVLPVSQRGRRCMNGQHGFTPEYVYDLKPRPPPHMKNSTKGCSTVPQEPSSSLPRRACSARNQSRMYMPNKRDNGMSFRSSPIISVGSRFAVPKDYAKGYPCAYQTRPPGQPDATAPRQNMACTSEPATNYQGRDSRRMPYRTQYLSGGNAPQEPNKAEVHHKTESLKCKSHPVIVECEGEVKKMNSEGDATGYANVDELDTIGRIAATLDVEDAEKLSDKQKMEIKEMSKFLIPRIPSSVQSLKEKKTIKWSESTTANAEAADGKRSQAEKFQISFRKSLDSILNQLESCETSLNAVKSRFSTSNKESRTSEESSSKKDIKDEIFNLREISEKLAMTGEETKLEKEEEKVEDSQVPVVRSDDTMEDESSGFESKSASRGATLDDTSALDLHRSKSYIVNLIDRALSKELGTVANEKQEKDLNPMKAVRRIERNKRTESCSVRTRNITDLECEPSSSCAKEEEPPYIKQLKELRWGHFKHIQQEVRRLEDLERFLDNCGTPDNSAF